MRVMVFVKATADSEAGVMPTTEMFEEMGAYNEQLVNAGIMQTGEGLKPTADGKRVAFDGDSRTVIDGPFGVTNELVAGFWIWGSCRPQRGGRVGQASSQSDAGSQ